METIIVPDLSYGRHHREPAFNSYGEEQLSCSTTHCGCGECAQCYVVDPNTTSVGNLMSWYGPVPAKRRGTGLGVHSFDNVARLAWSDRHAEADAFIPAESIIHAAAIDWFNETVW